MIILDKPYVSDFLIETIKKENYKVLDNEIARKYLNSSYLSKIEDASCDELFYANSENSINLIVDNMPDSFLRKMIDICKSKSLFRKLLKPIYPDYFFKEVDFKDLFNLDAKNLPYPIILKPDVGFLSFGVYTINNQEQWQKTLSIINDDIKKFEGIFPKEVVNVSKFLIESKIEGKEFALDAYFDENGKSVILNIFEHPFFGEFDVSDRLYFTSKKTIKDNLEKFENILDKIGSVLKFKNFPFHLELRANENEIIPIEMNPLRFCGWCITDIGYSAWGINNYNYFFKNLKPDWENILNSKNDDYYYFTIGDVTNNIEKGNIKIDYEKYLKNISNPLVIRKIDPNQNPVFAIVFAQTNDIEEIKKLLALDMKQFIKS